MIRLNDIHPQDVASAIFSTTIDVNAEFPALAARQLGWTDVPLLCTHELNVPGSLPLCIRVLLHWNTEKTQAEIHHVYIKDAVKLRPDICSLPPVDFQELEAWIEVQMQSLPRAK
jgi:chorismate mutase